MHRERKSRRPRYREATKDEFRIIRGAAHLDELFTDEELIEKLWLARHRIITIFYNEMEWRNGKFRKTDNYVIGVGKKQSELARYICSQIKRGFVSESDLPPRMAELSPRDIRDTISNLQYRIILTMLNQLCSPVGCDIWYDEETGIWQMSQSCHDKMKAEFRQARKAIKFDRRNWHGRPRNQARRRGTPPGASISYPPR